MTDMRSKTPTEQLADVLLGQPLQDYVLSRRPERSWRLIARDVYTATNGRIDVTHETLRGWYSELDLRRAS